MNNKKAEKTEKLCPGCQARDVCKLHCGPEDLQREWKNQVLLN